MLILFILSMYKPYILTLYFFVIISLVIYIYELLTPLCMTMFLGCLGGKLVFPVA